MRRELPTLRHQFILIIVQRLSVLLYRLALFVLEIIVEANDLLEIMVKNRVLKDVIPANSLAFLINKHARNDIFDPGTDDRVRLEHEYFPLYLVFDVLYKSTHITRIKRRFAIQYFVEHDCHRPDIAL